MLNIFHIFIYLKEREFYVYRLFFSVSSKHFHAYQITDHHSRVTRSD